MSPDVLARKLGRLQTCLTDLEPHRGRSAADIRRDPYAVERLLELVVQIASDVVTHLLSEQGVTPVSYRAAFEEAGRAGMMPVDLATRLADAAGLRNVLVHLYGEIDYDIVAASVGRALTDFGEFLVLFQQRLDDDADAHP